MQERMVLYTRLETWQVTKSWPWRRSGWRQRTKACQAQLSVKLVCWRSSKTTTLSSTSCLLSPFKRLYALYLVHLSSSRPNIIACLLLPSWLHVQCALSGRSSFSSYQPSLRRYPTADSKNGFIPDFSTLSMQTKSYTSCLNSWTWTWRDISRQADHSRWRSSKWVSLCNYSSIPPARAFITRVTFNATRSITWIDARTLSIVYARTVVCSSWLSFLSPPKFKNQFISVNDIMSHDHNKLVDRRPLVPR